MKLQNYYSQLVLAKNLSLLSSTSISLDKKQAVQWQYCVGQPWEMQLFSSTENELQDCEIKVKKYGILEIHLLLIKHCWK